MIYRLITITGGDCAGKETQSRLLKETLSPSVLVSNPDYDHWTGCIIRSILYRKPFYFLEDSAQPQSQYGRMFQQEKHPQVLQLLHNINTWDKQAVLKKHLQSSHVIADRYIEDAYAYGSIDGCRLDFLLELNRNFIQSDKVIVMLGAAHPRQGETQDINEKDTVFQDRVKDTFRSLAPLFPTWQVINTDEYKETSVHESISNIHGEICRIVSECVGQTIYPLKEDYVEYLVREWEKQRQLALTR